MAAFVAKAKGIWGRAFTLSPTMQKGLLLASVGYLALPYFIFYIGYLKALWALLLCVLLAAALVLFARGAGKGLFRPLQFHYVPVALGCLLLLFILTASGLGGITGMQAGDYERTNGVLADLTLRRWPVAFYDVGSGELYAMLNYYSAYFMPAAVIGKLFYSVRVAEVTLLLWTWLGFVLGVYWYLVASRSIRFRSLVVFLFFSGMDLVGYILENRALPGWGTHLDHWGKEAAGIQVANYHSMATAIRYSLMHYIGAWIICFVLLYLVLQCKSYRHTVFLVCLGLLWSPVTMVCVVPYGLYFLVRERFRLKEFFSLPSLLALVAAALPMLLYFLSMRGTIGYALELRGPGWLAENWKIYLLFLLLEFGLLGLCLLGTGAFESRMERDLVILSLVLLAILPLFVYGPSRDFSMRAAVLPWFVLLCFVPRALAAKGKRLWVAALSVCLVLGGLSNLGEYRIVVTEALAHPTYAIRKDLFGNSMQGFFLENQFVGDPDAAFYTLLAKPVPQRVETPYLPPLYLNPDAYDGFTGGVREQDNALLLRYSEYVYGALPYMTEAGPAKGPSAAVTRAEAIATPEGDGVAGMILYLDDTISVADLRGRLVYFRFGGKVLEVQTVPHADTPAGEGDI